MFANPFQTNGDNSYFFQGQDLKGKDFSYWDIRGYDFSNANLTDANFTGVRAGQPWRLRWLLLAFCSFWCCLYFYVSFFSARFWAENLTSYFKLENGDLGIILIPIIQLLIIGVIIKIKGLSKILINIALVFNLCLYGLIAFKNIFSQVDFSTGFWGYALVSFLLLSPALIILSGSIIFTICYLYAPYLTLATNILGCSFFLITYCSKIVLLTLAKESSSILLAMVLGWAILMVVHFYIAWRTILRDGNFKNLRKLALTVSCFRGTVFNGANLTNAKFYRANLRGTDFSYAILNKACFYRAKNLDRVESTETIRSTPPEPEFIFTNLQDGAITKAS